MKKIMRKAMTVLGSAALIGATIGSAVAANYPAPFSSEGAVVVVGTGADALDNTAAVNIQTDISSNLVVSGGSTTVTGGDSYLLEKTSTKFNLGDYAGDVVSTRVTDDNLPTLLADGKYIDNDNDEFDYTQKIDLTNATLRVAMFEDSDYASDEPTVGIRIANGAVILNYTLDMTDDPLWTDLATSDLPLMGKSYYVLDNSSTVGTSLTLLDSASDTILSEGESTTLSVGGKTYTASIEFISDTEVKLNVNGETTNSISEGQTFKLQDGSYLGVKDILYSSKDTGISKVEFSIGQGKLIITNGSEVELNEDTISGLTATITASSTELQSIRLDWEADDDLFVTETSSITMPGFEAVKISFGGMSYDAEEAIAIEADGDSSIVLKNFPLKDSTESINILYFDGTNYNVIGKDSDNKLATDEDNNGTLHFDGDTDDYFVASWNDTQDSESYLMRITNFKNQSGKQMATFQYKSDGAWTDAKVDADSTDTITIGNVEFDVDALDKDTKTANITTTTTGVSFNRLYSAEGLFVQLPWVNSSTSANVSSTTTYTAATACTAWLATSPGFANGALGYSTLTYNATATNTTTTTSCYPTSYILNVTEEDKNGNLASGNAIQITLSDNTNDETTVSSVDMGAAEGTFTEIDDSDEYRNFAYSELATEAMWDKSGDQYKLELTYHGEEATAEVYVLSADAMVSSNGEAGVLVVKDSESSAMSGKNMVVVGGSAINSVAADLLGSAYHGDSFTEATGVAAGEFLIQSFNEGGKIALLVAGYNADDTTKAATYLLNNDVDTTAGMKYVGTSATEASVVVA